MIPCFDRFVVASVWRAAVKLCFKKTDLGDIEDVESDQPWMYGRFVPRKAARELREMFRWLTDEDRDVDEDPPFPADWLDAGNWAVIDDDGKRRSIELPAVGSDGLITWRWSTS
jgi:hypothetical protein